MMRSLFFVTHPEVVIDPAIPVEQWGLSADGRARMRDFAARPEMADVRTIWSSEEVKAIEAAAILAERVECGVRRCHALGENDRRATGFLPPAEFEVVANAFFAEPEVSVWGWERAVDAQRRVAKAVVEIVAAHRSDDDIAIVAHGGVGTLLLCALAGRAINRSQDQPFQGHYWRASLPDLVVRHGWRSIAARVS